MCVYKSLFVHYFMSVCCTSGCMDNPLTLVVGKTKGEAAKDGVYHASNTIIIISGLSHKQLQDYARRAGH